MGGKTSTSTSQVQVPPSVLAQYQSVNSLANQTAQRGFQTYGGEFVAPVNTEQTSGITGTNTAATEAQPFYGAATGFLGATQAGTMPVNTAAEAGTAASSAPLTGSQIDRYLSPYLGTVLNSTEAIQNQENQQQQAAQLGDAIRSGAFGSDRTGIAAANLEQQQNLANANIVSGIANQGYESALGTAQGQQQIGLAGAQQLANIGQTAYGEGANTASELGSLGTGAESAGLAGAQAQIQAGTVQQQTQQAQDTALYNQFLQQQSYPFQVDQFLANIAEGTGALSGSTTTTRQPGGFFSDRRLKYDIKKIGETFDKQPVYSYKMHGDPRTHIGLIAQQVERKHPHAVGLAAGYKTVDYGKATEEASEKGHFYAGGLVRSRGRGSARTDAYRARGGLVPEPRRHYAFGGVSGGLDGVLQAQQQMYSQSPETQRNIPQQGGGGRGLVVANAPAAPPPSGASEINQTMGLANQGYKLYKTFSAPAAPASAPSSGLGAATSSGTSAATGQPLIAGGTDAAVGASGDAAAAGAGDAAATGAGQAAGTAAADAAAASAGEAAGSAAAGAAGSAAAGAAAGAGAGAATAGAADAAAALAAEYAAADAGVVAAMAAKRGGAIRSGYGGGGMPYSGGVAAPYASDSGSLQIPDQPNTNTLHAAPAAGKQPTGLQTMLYMGDPQNAGTLTGEVFSNQALASGGVAGRRGFDGGGGATDDTPDQTPPGSQPPDSSQASSPTGGLAGWWSRNKGIVLPVLEGVGAAMTAPTVHPGVAIAAGLEQAAKAYVPTQEGLAATQQIQAAAQSQEIQNRLAALKLGVAQQALAPSPAPVVPHQPAAAPSAPSTFPSGMPITAGASSPIIPSQPSAAAAQATQPSPGAAQTAAGLAAQYRAQFFVNTARTPEEQAEKDAAIRKDWAVGGNMFSQQADTDYQARVQRDQQNARNAAQRLADVNYAQATDPGATAQTRAAALVRYNALRQWTGDGTELVGGIVRNTRTNQPEIGTIAQQGFTPAQQADLMARAQELVNVPNSDGTFTQQPAWQAHHFPSPQAYAQMLMSNSTAVGTPTSSGMASASPAAGAPEAPSGQVPPAAAGSVPPPAASTGVAAPPTERGASPLPVAPAGATAAIPPTVAAPRNVYLSKALADPSFRIPPAPVAQGTTQSPMALETQKANIANAMKLLNDTDSATAVAATTLQYIRAAQSIMQSHGTTVGAYGPLIAEASRFSGPFTGKVDSTNYQELAKYLGNAAAQSAKANFPSATQQEVGMQFEELSPHVKMNADTINDLLAVNARVAANVIANGARAKMYVGNPQNPINQPLDFQKWAQKYYPVDKIANADATAINPKTGQKLYHINGQWVP